MHTVHFTDNWSALNSKDKVIYGDLESNPAEFGSQN